MPKKTIRLPFAFGEMVYHRAASERVKLIVTGFVISEHRTTVVVTCGDDMRGATFEVYELTTEFEPSFSTEC